MLLAIHTSPGFETPLITAAQAPDTGSMCSETTVLSPSVRRDRRSVAGSSDHRWTRTPLVIRTTRRLPIARPVGRLGLVRDVAEQHARSAAGRRHQEEMVLVVGLEALVGAGDE